jgi:hypothetical protein
MSEKEEILKNGYYYCNKCLTIPLIHILSSNDAFKIYAACKCTKNLYSYNTFNKLYFQKEKKDNLSEYKHEENLNEKINIEETLTQLNQLKEEINKFNLELKNNLISHYQKKLKEIEDIYESNKTINDKLESFMNILISNYKSNEKNSSNINNISINIKPNKFYKKNLKDFHPEELNDMQFLNYERVAKNYFSNQHLISPEINEFKTIKYLSSHEDSVNCFLELKNNIGVSCARDSYIIFYDLNKMESIFKFVGHSGGVNFMLKTPSNNLISCGEDSFIKLWTNINKQEYMNKDKKKVEIKPTFEIKTDEKIKKLIDFGENKFLANSSKGIYLYEYTDEKINLIESIHMDKLNDIILFQNEKEKLIIGYTYASQLFSVDCNNMEIIQQFKCQIPSWQNLIVQINKEEIIYGKNSSLDVFNIKKEQTKLSKETTGYINCLFKLKDGTLVRGERDGIRRYAINTLDEFPPLIGPYDDYDENHSVEQLNYLYEFSDGRIILCYRNSTIRLGKLKVG